MKRPLVTVAAGFVLGEVLALQLEQAAVSGFLKGLVWGLVLTIGMVLALGLGPAGGKRPARWRLPELFHSRKGKKQGRDAERRAFLLFFVLMSAGGFVGYVRGSQVRTELDKQEEAAESFAGSEVTVTGTIGKGEYRSDQTRLVLEEVKVQDGRREERLGRVMVYVDGVWEAGEDGREGFSDWRDKDRELEVGKKVRVEGKLEMIEGPRNPGEFDFRRYYRSKGVVCRLFGERVEIVGGEAAPYYRWLNQFRRGCSDILDQISLPEDSAVFKAVLLGDTSWLEPQVRSMYQRSGISHLLAVSGQHLAIIGGGMYCLLRRGGLGFKSAGGAAGILVVSFGVMTGSSGSAMRAVVMILCLWLSGVVGRTYDTLSALGLAAIALLFGQPYLLFQSGFQLSFGAVLAIGGPGSLMIQAWKMEEGWEKTLAVSLSVQMVITPVILYFYFSYPLYGMFLNLLVIPLVSVLMYSGILGISLGSIWIQGGSAAVGAGHYILQVYEWLCRMTEKLPGYSLVMGKPEWWQIIVYGAGIGGSLYGAMIWKEGEERTVKGLGIGLCSYILSFFLLFPVPVKGLEVICLDVGQGDGILMETRDGVILVDGGSSSEKRLGEKTMEPCLKSRGIKVIDYSIISHGDRDHISGVEYLLEESEDIRIKNLILPSLGKGEAVYQELEQKARERGANVRYMEAGERIELGGLKLNCLYAGNECLSWGEERNGHSLVLCADYKNFHMLLTGDMGSDQEEDLLTQSEGGGVSPSLGALQREHLSHITVLKTAHHGSDYSSSQRFLQEISPELAVISYGRENSYGHPSPQVLERFFRLKIPVMETGNGGAIILKTDGDRLWRGSFLGA